MHIVDSKRGELAERTSRHYVSNERLLQELGPRSSVEANSLSTSAEVVGRVRQTNRSVARWRDARNYVVDCDMATSQSEKCERYYVYA